MNPQSACISIGLDPTMPLYHEARLNGSLKRSLQRRRSKARDAVAPTLLRFSAIVFILNSILFMKAFHRLHRIRQLLTEPMYKSSILLSKVKPSAFTNLIPNAVDNRTNILHLYNIYESEQELVERSLRFPSVEERLKVYLSTWYVPPCPSNDLGTVQYNFVVGDEVVTGKMAPSTTPGLRVLVQAVRSVNSTEHWKSNESWKPMIDPQPLPDTLSLDTTVRHDRNLFTYDPNTIETCNDPFCTDVEIFLNPSLDRLTSTSETLLYQDMNDDKRFPLLLQFGDAEAYRATAPSEDDNERVVNRPMVPFLRKFRYSMTRSEIHRVTSVSSHEGACYSANQDRLAASTLRDPIPHGQAIISIVSNYARHFEPLNDVHDADISWERKRNMAVYRGALTGRNKAKHKSKDLKFCSGVPRCNLVYQTGNSSLVDAKLVPYRNFKYPISDPLNGVAMFGSSMTMAEMLQYKAIIMLEGNDVSSGLKWALFSNSVVLTQTPTCTSWAMEELLQPWVHYIPLLDDLSDVEQKVQWILDHDSEAKKIARNGKLWIADLVYHPDAVQENELVIDETFKRYRAHFTYNPLLNVYANASVLDH
jgi:Glycosyl transferase family 90